MNKWFIHSNGLTRTSLSVTATRVSNFVGKMCVRVFLHRQSSRPGGFSHSLPNTTG